MSKPDNSETQAAFNRAIEAYIRGDDQACLDNLQRAIDLDSGFVEALAWLGYVFCNGGQGNRTLDL